jgi:hypothetical protein
MIKKIELEDNGNILYRMDERKLETSEQKLKLKFGMLSFILMFLFIAFYYITIGKDDLLIFLIVSVVVTISILYAFSFGLKNAKRKWDSFYIKLNEADIEFGYDKPFYYDLEKTKWRKEKQCISWNNADFKYRAKAELIDKNESSFNRMFSGIGRLVIPKEMEHYDRLIREVKKKIAIVKR